MSLALLSGVNPRVCKFGPKVRLHEGHWNLNFVGVVDTKLLLHIDGVPVDAKQEHYISSPRGCIVQITIDDPGTEQYFSVFAEQRNGTIVSTT